MGYENTKKYGYGNFGNLASQYVSARQGYPEEVIDWLWSFMPSKDITILDLGCGTGISTRQLAVRGRKIIGCDVDEAMIKTAKEAKDDIQYIVGPADTLPFDDQQFDAVTAFGAFHWFANEKALSEIKRVLKRNGIFYIVNKNDVGGFKEGYKTIIKSVLEQNLPEVKKDYKPEDLLKSSRFVGIQRRDFETTEYFLIPEALRYFQSVSIWNLVPDNMKVAVLRLLENYCRERAIDGKIERKLSVRCVVGCMA